MTDEENVLPQELEDIIEKYTVQVLSDNPDDIISHAADYFTNLRDQRNEVGSENKSSSPTWKTDISNTLGTRGARRATVMGEPYDPEDDDGVDVEVFPKSDEEKERIKEHTKDVFLFRNLDKKVLDEVIDAMIPRDVKKDQLIIRQGDDGDFFYVVDRGTFEAFIKDDDTEEEKLVKTYKDSGSFGELALLHNQPRSATVKATTDGFLWAVSRRTFKRLIVKSVFNKRQEYIKLLESVPELRCLSEYDMLQVCDALTSVYLTEGEVLFHEGDEGDGMYFVEEGKVSVKVKSKKTKGEKEMARVTPGGYFGEMAIIRKQPRAATVTALEDTKLAFLDADDFERLLGPYEDVMKKRLDAYEKA